MYTIQKIYDATKRNKLTVSPEKVVIRFRSGATEEEKIRVEKFLTKAAEKLINDQKYQECRNTLRGNLAIHSSDTMYIVLTNESGSFSSRFYENEI